MNLQEAIDKLLGKIKDDYIHWSSKGKGYQALGGYFKESVVESRLETDRLRKLIIYYYLEDNSLSMLEPK